VMPCGNRPNLYGGIETEIPLESSCRIPVCGNRPNLYGGIETFSSPNLGQLNCYFVEIDLICMVGLRLKYSPATCWILSKVEIDLICMVGLRHY